VDWAKDVFIALINSGAPGWAAVALIACFTIYKGPEYLKVWLTYRGENKRINAEIERRAKLTDVEIERKMQQIEQRKHRRRS